MANIRETSREISLALIVVGAGLGMYLNFYVGNHGWNNVLMFISLLCLPNWYRVGSMKFHIRPQAISFILIYQFLILIYMFFSKAESKDYIFLFFTIIFILELCSLNRSDINWTNVIRYSWLLGWLCTVLCASTIVSGAYFIEYAKAHSGDGYKSILVDLSMAGNLVVFIVSCLYMIRQGSKFQIRLSLVGIIIALMLMLILGKRTPIIVSVLLLLYFIFKFYPLKRKVKKASIYYLVLGFGVSMFIFQIPIVSGLIVSVVEKTFHGIQDMLFGSMNSGMSAVERYNLREWAMSYIENNFGVLNYIFGAGFMVKWLDVPLLQAFLDMGLIGLCVYGYFILFVPLKVLFSRKSKNPYIFWGVGLCLYNLISIVNSGTPYGHVRWIPIIILYTLINYFYRYKRKAPSISNYFDKRNSLVILKDSKKMFHKDDCT